MTARPSRGLIASGIVAAAVAIAMRVHNALVYPLHRGFDADGNWRYIARLLQDWTLPAPGDDWATSHPPFFYYFAAAIGRLLGSADPASQIVTLRLTCAAIGLATVGLSVWWVWRSDPERPRRALLAGGLLLFLPVHVYMSAMLGEELVVAGFTSLAVVLGASAAGSDATWRRVLAIGVIAGLGMLTKLTGVLVGAAIAGAWLIDGWRRGQLGQAASRAVVVALVTAVVGGWYYARNLASYGYLYPKDLQVHAVMFDMPPGERGLADYLRLPAATFADPQLLDPDLLHSVWGSTYATVWFDGHRHFLPREEDAVRRVGTAIALLALLPTAAFAIGLGRGTRRWWQTPGVSDGPLVLLVAATLAGYVLFTFRNPWYASVKGSYLLGLSVPFAYYASEVLADWTSHPGPRSLAVWLALALLALLVAVTFTLGLVFWKIEGPGLLWQAVAPA